MNDTYNHSGNVVQLGSRFADARADHQRITAANYSRGPQFTPEAPMAIDVPHIEGPTAAPRYMRRDVDDFSTGAIWAACIGVVLALCLAVAVL